MRKIFATFILATVMTLPSVSHAALVPYGGLIVFSIPCTCGFVFNYHMFAPLFLGPIPMAGGLSAPQVITFPFYYLHPGAWALGAYVPGAQACWMYVGFGCAPLPGLGTITPFSGSSP